MGGFGKPIFVRGEKRIFIGILRKTSNTTLDPFRCRVGPRASLRQPNAVISCRPGKFDELDGLNSFLEQLGGASRFTSALNCCDS